MLKLLVTRKSEGSDPNMLGRAKKYLRLLLLQKKAKIKLAAQQVLPQERVCSDH